MNRDTTTSPSGRLGAVAVGPLRLSAMANEYAVDAWQRSILYADVRRQRGNQYQEHLQEQTPNVLDFASGGHHVRAGPSAAGQLWPRTYPAASRHAERSHKRPFVVVDPRAGHGPGIGGFKPDSEVGAALKAGHPCYFVGFLPDPFPARPSRTSCAPKRPSCAGSASCTPAAAASPLSSAIARRAGRSDGSRRLARLFGPIIVAARRCPYWAGDMPMRYAGGLTGGSWLTALTSDLGAGRFDGAWLVQNFENLDPANTLWSKQYNLYANVDTEGPRYLQFEKYWGGHVFLNDVEMQYIVDNLFIGNKLSTANW